MGKGDETRLAVLDQAVEVARAVGLRGLTIGTLAERTQMSKSGLFGHFKSKESLQMSVLGHARADFEATVARPAMLVARGEPRIRALFDNWVKWEARPGGCPFVAAATEFDDQAGPVRDLLVRDQRDMHDMVATVFRTGIGEGHFRTDHDPEQFAQDMTGVILAYHHALRLLGDTHAEARARRAFDALIAGARR